MSRNLLTKSKVQDSYDNIDAWINDPHIKNDPDQYEAWINMRDDYEEEYDKWLNSRDDRIDFDLRNNPIKFVQRPKRIIKIIIQSLAAQMDAGEWAATYDFWRAIDTPDPENIDITTKEASMLCNNIKKWDPDFETCYDQYCDNHNGGEEIDGLQLIHEPNSDDLGENELLSIGYNPYKRIYLISKYEPRNAYEKQVCDYFVREFRNYRRIADPVADILTK